MHPLIRDTGKALFQTLFSEQFQWRLPSSSAAVALTFDDGPDSAYTPAMLDILGQAQIKATFFVVGSQAERYPAIVRRIVDEGHGIGGHTYHHREIVLLTQQELESEMTDCRTAIRDACGVDTMIFRPPRGKINMRSVYNVCRLGYRLVHWSKTYSDYRSDGIDKLVERMTINPPQARDIILLHDIKPDTVQAIGRLAPAWKSQNILFNAL